MKKKQNKTDMKSKKKKKKKYSVAKKKIQKWIQEQLEDRVF